ncbi:hypothetical protein SAMN05444487_105156 [Marininema mesophilum]|uniref:Sulfotransferase family protein n=1 Tax=Marininema mesophilum TaxID=1048340 RepID=A0A1H2VP65_9BACL|nr:sulfotransferase [Marininema mesophilum]SDW69659.1 hypothetical protein SAMN05444487_105156 [Marininema mesophilum]
MALLQNARAICILGMHRSGTSLITRAVNLLGPNVGTPNLLMAPHETNPTGFWEHLEIVQIHKQIMKKLNSSWDATKPLPIRWWISKEIQPYKESLKKIIIRDFATKNLWMWKDPRTCLLLPLWKSILNELAIDLRCVLVVRNPIDVASSLKRRDGLAQEKSIHMWALHTLSSLQYSQGTRRVLIHYDQFLANWQPSLRHIATTLDLPWPPNESALQKTMSYMIQPDLRHSHSSVQDLICQGKASPLLLTLYRLCLIVDRFPERMTSPWMIRNVRHLCDSYYSGKPLIKDLPSPLRSRKKTN